jgi:hypothetical protein
VAGRGGLKGGWLKANKLSQSDWEEEDQTEEDGAGMPRSTKQPHAGEQTHPEEVRVPVKSRVGVCDAQFEEPCFDVAPSPSQHNGFAARLEP